jgi:hypothetical protein
VDAIPGVEPQSFIAKKRTDTRGKATAVVEDDFN